MALSRREFVGTTAFALAGVSSAAGIGQEQRQNSDPVLDAIVANFKELRRDGDEQPGQRRGVLRATETLTGVLAAHLSRHYDPDLKRSIRQQLQRKGRAALVQELTTRVNKPGITHEAIYSMLARLERDGMGGVLRDVQKATRRMRENAPPDYLQVRSVTQFDFCSDLNWIIGITEMSAALACALAAGFAALNPAADAACAGATMALALYLAMKMWYNC